MNELMRRLLWLPVQASTFAKPVDNLHYFVITVTMVASTITGLLAFFFFFKYRERRENQSTPMVVPSVKFEIAVIGVPLFFFLLWFVQGYKDYVWYTTPPKDTMDVYVMGKKWMWKFAYGGGGPNAIGTLHVPVNRPVRLLMTSRDVIHSFFVPDFRIKQDVLPGRYTETWFEATKTGRYQVLCTEYCGTWHSQMWGEIVVMSGARLRQVDERPEAGARRPGRHGRGRRRQLPRLDRRVRQEGRDDRGVPELPLARRPAAHRADLARSRTCAASRSRVARSSWPTRGT